MESTSAVTPLLHHWHIEAREYARQESRRGRRHAFEHLDPSRTALVVVDMVPFFLEEGSHAQGIVPNISLLADALRAAGGTVVWVLPGAGEPSAVSDEFLGPEIARMFRAQAARVRCGIDTVLITGTVANVCCESSARDASTLGYRVVIVADANAARRDQDLNATLHTVYRTFGDVRPTSEVLELIAGG
jgi:nicotinamidase-related amidase